jgi:hypothetical protein
MRLSVSRLAVFLAVLGTASALLHGYAWLRVVADPSWPAPWTTILGALALVLAAGMPLAMIGMRVLPERFSVPLAWAAYLWLGTLYYLDVTLLALDGSRLVFENVAQARALAPWVSDGTAGARAVASVVLALTLGLVTWGASRGLAAPRLREVSVEIAGLPKAFDGFRIAQLTDVHVGPMIRRRFVESIVDRVNALSPDLVAITGDLVDGSVAELASEVAPLARLSAPHGVRFVTGNHELFTASMRGARICRRSASTCCATGTSSSSAAVSRSCSRASTTHTARASAAPPISAARSRASTEPRRSCSSRTSRAASTRPPRAAWPCSSRGIRTAVRCSPSARSCVSSSRS